MLVCGGECEKIHDLRKCLSFLLADNVAYVKKHKVGRNDVQYVCKCKCGIYFYGNISWFKIFGCVCLN